MCQRSRIQLQEGTVPHNRFLHQEVARATVAVVSVERSPCLETVQKRKDGNHTTFSNELEREILATDVRVTHFRHTQQ